MNKKLLLPITAAFVLGACSGGGSDTTSIDDDTNTNDNSNEIVTDAQYSKVSGDALADTLKASLGTYLVNRGGMMVDDMAVVETASADSASGDSASGFSTTNVQEQGVAEGDRVKYDGDFMYIVEEGRWDIKSAIRVLERGSDNTLTEVNRLPITEQFGSQHDIYLHSGEKRLASVGNYFSGFFRIADVAPGYFHSPYDVTLFDVSNPAEATKVVNYSFDGNIVDSRRIDENLYLVGVYAPFVDGWQYGESDAIKSANDELLSSIEVNQLLPTYRQNDGESQPLVSDQACYVPTDEEASPTQIVTIVKIDMTAPENFEVMCMLGSASGIYMSQENLYLISDQYTSTTLDKFSLSPSLDYQGSGQVSGTLGWNNPSFRLSEYQGELRVVHTERTNKIKHTLSVLVQEGAELVARATLPNEQQPEPIGKPGEDVYAVRYFGERAYIVTFERIDPLYVIDVPAGEAPVVLGSLEIPGFSDYLHPLENNYLLGVGQEVEVVTQPGGWQRVTSTGVKLSLFDINDPSNPIEAAKIVKPSGYTPVSYDHRALAVLKLDDVYRFGLPMQSWSICDEVCTTQYRSLDSMLMVEVDTQATGGSLKEIRNWSIEQEGDRYINAWRNRSIIHKDDGIDLMYFLRGNKVYSTPWAEAGESKGPF